MLYVNLYWPVNLIMHNHEELFFLIKQLSIHYLQFSQRKSNKEVKVHCMSHGSFTLTYSLNFGGLVLNVHIFAYFKKEDSTIQVTNEELQECPGHVVADTALTHTHTYMGQRKQPQSTHKPSGPPPKKTGNSMHIFFAWLHHWGGRGQDWCESHPENNFYHSYMLLQEG